MAALNKQFLHPGFMDAQNGAGSAWGLIAPQRRPAGLYSGWSSICGAH